MREEISEIVLVRWREQYLRRTTDPKPGQLGERLVREQPPAQFRHRGFEIGRDVGEGFHAHPTAFHSPGNASPHCVLLPPPRKPPQPPQRHTRLLHPSR